MPNQRAPGQTMVGCYVDEKFAAEIDRARGGKSRSDFLREILFRYLKKLGYDLKPEWQYAPDRTGKGRGRRIVTGHGAPQKTGLKAVEGEGKRRAKQA